ncbi:MAG: hypothetical protein ACLFOC_11545 [Campylobacterales bacterium]
MESISTISKNLESTEYIFYQIITVGGVVALLVNAISSVDIGVAYLDSDYAQNILIVALLLMLVFSVTIYVFVVHYRNSFTDNGVFDINSLKQTSFGLMMLILLLVFFISILNSKHYLISLERCFFIGCLPEATIFVYAMFAFSILVPVFLVTYRASKIYNFTNSIDL